MRKKVALPFNNCLGDTQNCVEALPHIFDQPLGFLQLRTERSVALGLLHGIGIHRIHAQARHDVVIEQNLPAIFGRFDNDIGHHIVGPAGGKCGAGMRIALSNDYLCFAQVFIVAAECFLDFIEIALRKQRQAIFDDGQCQATCDKGNFRQALDLQRQAFGGAARTDAGGVETLQQLERNRQFIYFDFKFFGQAREDVFGWLFQVTMVAERIDDQFTSARSRKVRTVRRACSSKCSRSVMSWASSCGRESSSSGVLPVRATSSKLHSASPLTLLSSPPRLSACSAASASVGALLTTFSAGSACVDGVALRAPSASSRTELSSASSRRSSKGLSDRICSSS